MSALRKLSVAKPLQLGKSWHSEGSSARLRTTGRHAPKMPQDTACAGVSRPSDLAWVASTNERTGVMMKPLLTGRAAPARLLLALALSLGACAAQQAQLKETVATQDAPAAIGPYSQGIKAGGFVFLSGQIAIDPKANQMSNGSIEEQTRQALDNIAAVLKASGLSMENVVNTTVYLKDVNDFARMNAVYATYFKDRPPARATIQVARLPRDALVEIAAIASR